MRTLATIQVISDILPIPDADRIEVARVLGWNVVVPKGAYSVGDKVVYCEVDSFLREDNPLFAEYQERGQKKITVNGEDLKGHVVRTIKLRGQVSQGLIMSLDHTGVSGDEGDDVSDDLGIVKWEAPIPMNAGIIGDFDTRFAPKTDAIRAQSISQHWDEILDLDWTPTVKVDGTSQTLVNDNGELRIFGRNWELDDTAAGLQVAKEWGLADSLSPGEAVQFELAGPGIQNNRAKLDKVRPFVFSVWRDRAKLPRDQWAIALTDASAPLAEDLKPEGNLDEMIEKVNGLRGRITKDALDEGVVYHLHGDAPLWLDSNVNFKIINNKFLLKHGE